MIGYWLYFLVLMPASTTPPTRPFVSIILVSYNSSDFTIPCIESIRANTKAVDYEIVVIDNNSTAAERAKLHNIEADNQIKFGRSQLNLGFSGGNMVGVQLANSNADYYFLLNNDTILLNDVCDRLSQYMEMNLDVGVCTPQTFKADGSFESSFTYFPTLSVKLLGHSLLRKFNPAAYPDYKKCYEQPIHVPVVTGCAMFIRGEVLRQLGGARHNSFFVLRGRRFLPALTTGRL